LRAAEERDVFRASIFPIMNSHDPVVARQLPVIQKIIHDETWLEGERRGCPVPPTDPVVREKVCTVVLRVGADLRRALSDPNSAN
jgi:hypothetical protein